MTDREKLKELLSDLPYPDDITSHVNPYDASLREILIGLALTTVTFQFYYLQYILSAIGILLLYFGFRSLRQENVWFRVCFIVSGIRILCTFASFYILTTPLSKIGWLNVTGSVIGVLLLFLLLFSFRTAVFRAFDRIKTRPHADPLLYAIVWYALVCLLALFALSMGWIVFIFAVIFYGLIIRSLYQTGQELVGGGYQIQTAPIHIGKKPLAILYAVLLLLSLGIGCVMANRVPMKAYTVDTSAQTQHQATRSHLEELGFPKEILQELRDEDIDGLGGAIRCETKSEDLSFNGKIMTSTMVYTELPGGKLRTVVYFQWHESTAIPWQEALQIQVRESTDHASGRILYDQNGTTYAANLTGLDSSAGPATDPLFNNSYNQLLTKFSYPLHSSNQRGYVVFSRGLQLGDLYTNTLLNYYHQTNPFVLPYTDIREGLTNGTYDTTSLNYRQHLSSYATAYKINYYGNDD